MGCGCRKVASAKAWVYTAPDGTITEKPTQVEALAMQVRAGHVGTVAPK